MKTEEEKIIEEKNTIVLLSFLGYIYGYLLVFCVIVYFGLQSINYPEKYSLWFRILMLVITVILAIVFFSGLILLDRYFKKKYNIGFSQVSRIRQSLSKKSEETIDDDPLNIYKESNEE